MFCPNCGTQNPDPASTCQKCGFALKPAGPKFKGTMLMVNSPGGPVAPPAAPAPAAAPAPPAAPAQPPAQAAPPAGAPAALPSAMRPKLKGTMIGVAPPAMGSNLPTAGGAAPAPAGPAPAPMAPATAPMAAPPAPVNPLGGTMVADASAMAGFAAGGAADVPPPPQAIVQQAEAILSQPPPGHGFDQGGQQPGYGQPTAPQFAAPPPAGQYGGPGQPQQQGWAPPTGGQQIEPIPGQVGAPNPIVTVLLIVLTCGIYGIYLLWKNRQQP